MNCWEGEAAVVNVKREDPCNECLVEGGNEDQRSSFPRDTNQQEDYHQRMQTLLSRETATTIRDPESIRAESKHEQCHRSDWGRNNDPHTVQQGQYNQDTEATEGASNGRSVEKREGEGDRREHVTTIVTGRGVNNTECHDDLVRGKKVGGGKGGTQQKERRRAHSKEKTATTKS